MLPVGTRVRYSANYLAIFTPYKREQLKTCRGTVVSSSLVDCRHTPIKWIGRGERWESNENIVLSND